MSAPKGNKFWQARSSHGKKPIFETPDALWEAAEEYFTWCHENPLFESKAFSTGEGIVQEPLPKMRAMTITGLLIFLDISRACWDNYRIREGYVDICAAIGHVIYTQKLEGAAAGLLNHAIIARELGLSDKRDVTTTKNETIGISDKTAEILRELAGKGADSSSA